MRRPERLHFVMPEEFPTANKVAQANPNNRFPVNALLHVFTDDGHLLTFTSFRKSLPQRDFHLSLVDAKPPITIRSPEAKEVNVRDGVIIKGKEFTLDSTLPVVIGRTTFIALQMFANIETMNVPMDGFPIKHDGDIKEAI